MNPPYTREHILEGLVIDIADCLAIEPEEVTPEALFFTTLDGESIEMLDLSFRIHKRFGIRFRYQEFGEGWEFDSTGRLSASTLQHLAAEFPGIDWLSRIASAPGSDPRDLVTVELIAEILFLSQAADVQMTMKE